MEIKRLRFSGAKNADSTGAARAMVRHMTGIEQILNLSKSFKHKENS